jgi:hypothetical protein
MDTWKANHIEGMNEEYGGEEKSESSLDAWRAEIEQARSNSYAAYRDFIDSMFFYYGEAIKQR